MNNTINELLNQLLGPCVYSFGAEPPSYFESMLRLSQSMAADLPRFAVLLPDAALINSGGEHTQALLSANVIDAVIRLPVHLPTIFILNRQKTQEFVLFIDASTKVLDGLMQSKIAGAYRRAHPAPQPETESSSPVCYAAQFERLQAGVMIDGLAYLASPAEIDAAAFNLSPQRYVEV